MSYRTKTCLAALNAAFRFGQPEIWNSDQGSQFTAADFLAPLKQRGIAISMDGRAAAHSTDQSLRRALADYTGHYHAERNHQGKGNVILFPNPDPPQPRVRTKVHCRERLGGLLKYYCRAAPL